MDGRDRLRKVDLDDRGACKSEPNSLPVILVRYHPQARPQNIPIVEPQYSLSSNL